MNENDAQYNLNQAEIALNNGQYETALELYRKALNDEPDNLLALSRAGAVCMMLEKYENALRYFNRAIEVDPDNGDNYFNLGNAHFFQDQYSKAFDCYVDAKERGCSEDITARLYYQMALLCSVRGDIKSALIYMRMCEDADASGTIAASPDLLSEKAKLYMSLEDYDNAERSAAQLVAAAPAVFANYMVYFSLLMARRRYSAAQRALSDAEKYADMSDDDRATLLMQRASVYIALAEADSNLKQSYYQKAVNTLNAAKAREGVTAAQKNEIRAALAEAYMKMEQYDRAIACLKEVLVPVDVFSSLKNSKGPEPIPFVEPAPDEIMQKMQSDVDLVAQTIDPADLELYSEVRYDEEGNPVRIYDERAFRALEERDMESSPEAEDSTETEETADISEDLRDRLNFLMLSCVMAKDDFTEAKKWAGVLKNSGNEYYAYFGLYTEALAERKLMENPEDVARKYAETIAFFRSKSFENPRDTLASIFRARLYAEEGSYAKAGEIARLLSESDQKAVLDYIESCKNGR